MKGLQGISFAPGDGSDTHKTASSHRTFSCVSDMLYSQFLNVLLPVSRELSESEEGVSLVGRGHALPVQVLWEILGYHLRTTLPSHLLVVIPSLQS